MMEVFSDETRRDPYPLYEQIRSTTPLLREPQSGLWMIFDYDGVKRVLADHETFSSRHGPADWMIFQDPPHHAKLRALVSQAFTPRSIANLEPRIRDISRQLLDQALPRGQMDLAADYSVPLPMMVISELLGIPPEDRPRFERWNQAILEMSYLVPAGRTFNEQTQNVMNQFMAVTVEMNGYLSGVLEQRRSQPKDDLLTRLASAELDGQRLTQADILGFFQLLLLAGQETTTNLINNSILCFIENPDAIARLREQMRLLPSAIEEVLRFRSPLQWMFRLTKREVELHGETIPAGKVVLAMIGSANRDPKQFVDAETFDIARDPNPHIGFGHGNHFCLGAALARLEARTALTDLLKQTRDIKLASDEPWEPRKGLHVHGPISLLIRFEHRAL
jgi:cytochrome P450